MIRYHNLLEAGIKLEVQTHDEHRALKKKIQTMKERGLSYQSISDAFNLWKIPTRTGEGNWHGKTVREVYLDFN